MVRAGVVGALVAIATAASLFAEPRFPVRVQHDIVYGRLELDLYEPDAPQLKHRPVVVFAHGGGFTRGSKTSEAIPEFCEAIAALGYACASINYRLAGDIAAAAADAAEAVRWLRRNAKDHSIDGDRIVLAGHSAGASLALKLAYSEAGRKLRIRAVIPMSGALDGIEMHRGDAPLCIVQGTLDTAVSIAEAKALAKRARGAGVPYELLLVENTGHGTLSALDRNVAGQRLLDRIARFLRVHVGEPR